MRDRPRRADRRTLSPVLTPSEPALSDPLVRHDALRVLALPPSADISAVKRAYRQLARTHHPDLGGDADTFHELQRAYELLVGSDAPAPVPAGRPSRDRAAWSSTDDGATRPVADVASLDWDTPLEQGRVGLSRDLVARWLAAPTSADASSPVVRRLTATSRAPGSRLNRAAPRLSPDLTSAVTVDADTDDRGRVVVAAVVEAAPRRARRVLEDVTLDGGWMRRRGSATTRLRWTGRPDGDPRVTAVHTADVLDELLDRARWPLAEWTRTR